MKSIHIVGKKGSFTHEASMERYPGKHRFVPHSSHHDLVTALIARKIPKHQPSVVPLWNSNTGVINMKNVTETTRVFMGEAGRICDLWPHEILFRLAIHNGSLCPASRIYSVRVAEHQCSRFLQHNRILESGRFVGCDTTTEAMAEFLQKRQNGDGVLCGEPLLHQNALNPLPHVTTNPNNMTVFATVGSLPRKQPAPTQYFLGCFTTPIEGHELPVEFVDYYERLVERSLVNQRPVDVAASIPKILFIVRDIRGSKVLMLLEMQAAADNEAAWETPDVEDEITVAEVGGLQFSYTSQAANLVRTRFPCDKFCFYGADGAYIWMSPPLMIAVHGYDKDLVRESARVQVLRLKALADTGHQVSREAKKVLELAADPAKLGLSSDSLPVPK